MLRLFAHVTLADQMLALFLLAPSGASELSFVVLVLTSGIKYPSHLVPNLLSGVEW